jgi:hypothetical protein
MTSALGFSKSRLCARGRRLLRRLLNWNGRLKRRHATISGPPVNPYGRFELDMNDRLSLA